MKKIFLFAFLAVSFLSCVKPDTPKVFVPSIWTWTGTDPMSAVVNGKDWQGVAGQCTYAEASGWKTISGTGADNTHITVASTDFAVGSEYPLMTGAANSNASYIPLDNEVFASPSGTNGKCKILENDAIHIKGLFYFQAVGPVSGSSVKVTKGYFNITK